MLHVDLEECVVVDGTSAPCFTGEVVFCSANPILKYTQDELSQRGVFGTLVCTNFRVSFISDEAQAEDTVRTP